MLLRKCSLPRGFVCEPRGGDGELEGVWVAGRAGVEHLLVKLSRQNSAQLSTSRRERPLPATRRNAERRKCASGCLVGQDRRTVRLGAVREVEFPVAVVRSQVQRYDFIAVHVLAGRPDSGESSVKRRFVTQTAAKPQPEAVPQLVSEEPSLPGLSLKDGRERQAEVLRLL